MNRKLERKRSPRRRATVLLMIVGLLAMLFIILSAYITLARFDRQTMQQVQSGRETAQIVDTVHKLLRAAMVKQWTVNGRPPLDSGFIDPKPIRLPGETQQQYDDRREPLRAVAMTYAYEDAPGALATKYLASREPVRDVRWDPRSTEGSQPSAYVLPTTTSTDSRSSQFLVQTLTNGTQLPLWTHLASSELRVTGFDPIPHRGLMLDANGTKGFDKKTNRVDNDYNANARRPFADADGDGIVDSAFGATALLTQVANAAKNITVKLPNSDFDYSDILPTDDKKFESYSAAEKARALAYQRFDEVARYEIAARVEANGGKIPLFAPGNSSDPEYPIWNRQFAVQMFNFVKHPDDDDNRPENLGEDFRFDDKLFNLIAGDATSVEAALARRGGRLGTAAVEELPPGLRALESAFAKTVNGLGYGGGGQTLKEFPWQRFNLGTVGASNGGEWEAFVRATSLDITDFNENFVKKGRNIKKMASNERFRAYQRRALLTTESYSDEVARVQAPATAITQYNLSMNPPSFAVETAEELGMRPGQIKYYLGKISQLFYPFDSSDPRYVSGREGEFICNDAKGAYTPPFESAEQSLNQAVFNELAAYFYDMLGGHGGWAGTARGLQNQDDFEIVAQRTQAMMLAVNLVAACAPRKPNGFVDLVYYNDFCYPQTGNGSRSAHRYIGVGPQPYVTQAIAHRYPSKPSGDDLDSADQLGLLIELYNPQDPLVVNSADMHALRLDQFAISVSDAYQPFAMGEGDNVDPPRHLIPLSPDLVPGIAERMPGRTFYRLQALAPGTDNPILNGDWNGDVPPTLVIPDLRNAASANTLRVKLWKRGNDRQFRNEGENSPGPRLWVQVDELEMDISDLEHRYNPPARDPSMGAPDEAHKAFEDWNGSYVNTWRDMETETYFGVDPEGLTPPARWRCVLATPGDWPSNATDRNRDVAGDSKVLTLLADLNVGEVKGDVLPKPKQTDSNGNFRSAPTTPFVLMNAGADPTTFIRGVLRPASFPTVGFMLFVPRYSHMEFYTFGAVGQNGAPSKNIERDPAWRTTTKASVWTNMVRRPMGVTLFEEFEARKYGFGATGSRPPADFGYMPTINNTQIPGPLKHQDPTSTMAPKRAGKVPWGMLVYDYFTTLNPNNPNGVADNAKYTPFPVPGNSNRITVDSDAIDPFRVPGRINVNAAPWMVLAGLPVIGPDRTNGDIYQLRPDYNANNAHRRLSPAFWKASSGLMTGFSDPDLQGNPNNPKGARLRLFYGENPRSDGQGLLVDVKPVLLHDTDDGAGTWRLGPYLAQAAVSYRDRVRMIPCGPPYGRPLDPDDNPYWAAEYRNLAADEFGNPLPQYRQESNPNEDSYDPSDVIRRGNFTNPSDPANPLKMGFVALGELLNVKGFDSGAFDAASGLKIQNGDPLNSEQPDYFRAISLLALLDTQFLTTRSNTFTAYVSVMDRENPQSSLRSQFTIDRGNLLPKLVYGPIVIKDKGGKEMFVVNMPLLENVGDTNSSVQPAMLQHNALPQILIRREMGYYNARYDN